MKKLLLLVTTLFALNANASILVEPYIGYSAASFKNNNSSFDETFTSSTLGGRVGFQYFGFMGGLEGQISPEYEIDNADYSDTRIGVFAGYDLPILFRAWVSYFFSVEKDYKSFNTSASGSGYSLGVGFTGLPFLSLNLEYRAFNFDEYENGANADLDENQVLLSLSFPLNF